VKEEDTGVNFFVGEECVGQPRAKVCCEMLQELNPDVKGRYINEVWIFLFSVMFGDLSIAGSEWERMWIAY
jgi:hypothetical protein